MDKTKTHKYISVPKSLIESEKNNKLKSKVKQKYDDEGSIKIKKGKSLLIEEEEDNESVKSDEKKKSKNKKVVTEEKPKKVYKNQSVRLSETPRKPSNPATLFINVEDVKEQLKYYDIVPEAEIEKLLPGQRIKYMEVIETELEDGSIDTQYKIKQGGVIIVNADEYLVLANNKKTWCVQLKTQKHLIFLEKFEEVRKNLELQIKKHKATANRYEKTIVRMRNENEELKNIIEQMKQDN